MTQLRPFLSIFIFIAMLLSVVFVKMESRRIGYSLLRKNRIEKSLIDDRRQLDMHFARLTRPGRIEHLATTKYEMKKAGRGQIVQLFYRPGVGESSISRIQ